MPGPLPDPCLHRQPEEDHLIFLPGSPTEYIVDHSSPSGRAIRNLSSLSWNGPAQAPGTALPVGGPNASEWNTLCMCEIRTASVIHVKYVAAGYEPTSPYTFDCTGEILLGFYTPFITDWLPQPPTLPEIVHRVARLGELQEFDWLVHADTIQAICACSTGHNYWHDVHGTADSNWGWMSITFAPA